MRLMISLLFLTLSLYSFADNGDSNNDGNTNILDVISTINQISAANNDLKSDCNLDSFVNVLDVICIINIIVNETDNTCELSGMGQLIHEAAKNANPTTSSVDLDNLLSLRNKQTHVLLPPDIFPAFGEALTTVNHEVDIQTFLFAESDAVEVSLGGLKTLETRLSQENRHGDPVLIRFSLNTLDFTALLTTAKGKAEQMFAGVAALNLDPQLIKIEIGTHIHTFVGSNHSKSGIIDGKIAFIGGANFDATNDFSNPAFDSAYVYEGDVLPVLQEDFDATWALSNVWDCDLVNGVASCTNTGLGTITHAPEVLNVQHNITDCLPMITLTRKSRNNLNNKNDNPSNQGFLAAMEAAQSEINIMTPNMNDDKVLRGIKDAARRGVQVNLVLSFGYEDWAESLPFQGGTNAKVVNDIFVRNSNLLDKIDIRWYSVDGIAFVRGNEGNASHLKFMSVDKKIMIVGSSNMDTQSWNHSSETNVVIDDASVTQSTHDIVFAPAFSRAIPATINDN